MAQLILVPTPVGNLGDITLRSLETLKNCDCIYAEDTRVTKKLLMHYDISKPVYPFHAHNEHKVVDQVVDRILANDTTVLVSDAGTPGISDPGFLLVRACISKDIVVNCLPGATAFVPALVASGFPCDRFVFEGFLPHKKGRQTKMMELAAEERTVILYESPHRLNKCLQQIGEFFGADRQICVAREISKLFEDYQRGTASELLAHFEQKPAKGEIVILIHGK